MATRQIKVVISVQDGATKKMKDVERKFRDTGKAADDASKRFMHFNRTLFTTTAFVGTFIAAFKSMGSVISQGADLSRMETAFQNIFGKNADVLKMISSFTDTAVDEMDAMRASIRLSSKDLGLGQGEISEMLARGAVAAKKAGMTSSEGAKAIAEAIRTGNIEAADNLNIINKGGIAYKAYEAAIAKASGTMSPAVKIMFRKKLILDALRESTEGYMRGNRDLKDVLTTANNSMRRFTASAGEFLGKALGPLIDSVSEFGMKAATAIKEWSQNKKFLETAKYITIATGAVIGLAGALGTLKLATIALGSFATGFPGLMVLLGAGIALFAGLTTKADGLNEKFKVFINFFKGIWQLVSSFDEGTGLGTMDKEIADLMVRVGLMTKEVVNGKEVYDGFLVNISRGVTVVKKFVTGLATGIKTAFDSVVSVFNTISDRIKELLNLKSGPWARDWLTSAESIGEFFGKWILPVIGGMIALKGMKVVLGSLFGGGGKGPKGTPMDPLFVTTLGGALGKAGSIAAKIPGVSKLGTVLSTFMQGFILRSKVLGEIFTNPAGKLAGLRVVLKNAFRTGFTAIGTVLRSGASFMLTAMKTGASLLVTGIKAIIPFLGPAIALAAAAAAGVYAGQKINEWADKNTQGETEEGFTGNIFERGLFKLDKWTGLLGGSAQQFIDAQQQLTQSAEEEAAQRNKIAEKRGFAKRWTAADIEAERERNKKAQMAPNVVLMDDYRRKREEADKDSKAGKPSQVTNPRIYKDEMEKVDEMAMEMADLQGAKRDQAQKAMEQALSADSEGGASITAKEMATFKALLEALNSSELTKNTKIMVDKMDNKAVPGSRRNGQ